MPTNLKLVRAVTTALSALLLLQPAACLAQGSSASNASVNDTQNAAKSSAIPTEKSSESAVNSPSSQATTPSSDSNQQAPAAQVGSGNGSSKKETKVSKHRKSKKEQSEEISSNKCFMWKVTGKKGRSAYLLGSMHLVLPNFYPLKPEIEKAFKDSSSMVCEANIKAMPVDKVGALAMAKGVYLNDDNIHSHISKETNDALEKVFEGKGGTAKVQKMRPWLLATLIIVLGVKKLGYDEKIGIDNHFLTESAADGKKIYELEGAEFQLNLISGLSDDLQEKFLLSSLLDMKELESSMSQMNDAWKSGNAKALDELLSKTFIEHPELADIQKLLITDRNVTMTDGIEKLLKEKEHPFVVVGAAHLVGDKGIVELMKKKHYKAVQVNSQQ